MQIPQNIVDNHSYPNFPKHGVNFLDLFGIMNKLGTSIKPIPTTFDGIVLLPESRGFVFWNQFNFPVALRKPGKLAGTVGTISTVSEYSTVDFQFMFEHLLAQAKAWLDSKGILELTPEVKIPVYFFDDILATGGTASAVEKFFDGFSIEDKGVKYVFDFKAHGFYTSLNYLNGFKVLSKPVYSVWEVIK